MTPQRPAACDFSSPGRKRAFPRDSVLDDHTAGRGLCRRRPDDSGGPEAREDCGRRSAGLFRCGPCPAFPWQFRPYARIPEIEAVGRFGDTRVPNHRTPDVAFPRGLLDPGSSVSGSGHRGGCDSRQSGRRLFSLHDPVLLPDQRGAYRAGTYRPVYLPLSGGEFVGGSFAGAGQHSRSRGNIRRFFRYQRRLLRFFPDVPCRNVSDGERLPRMVVEGSGANRRAKLGDSGFACRGSLAGEMAGYFLRRRALTLRPDGGLDRVLTPDLVADGLRGGDRSVLGSTNAPVEIYVRQVPDGTAGIRLFRFSSALHPERIILHRTWLVYLDAPRIDRRSRIDRGSVSGSAGLYTLDCGSRAGSRPDRVPSP